MGIVWSPPFRLEFTDGLQEKNNLPPMELADSWRNRLAGKRDPAGTERYTTTDIRIQKVWELLEAGLMGPVRILSPQ